MRRIKRIKKKYILSAIVFLLGLLLSLYLINREKEESLIGEDLRIVKNEWKDGDLKINLTAHFNDDSEDFYLELKEREYTEEEFETEYIEFLKKIGELILGENESFSEVNKDLVLKNSYEEYPFSIHWESSDKNVVDDTGHLVGNKDTDENTDITLFGTCVYEDFRRTFEVQLRVVPAVMSEREKFVYRLERELFKGSNEDLTKKTFLLPGSFDGVEIKWSEKKGFSGIWVLIISAFLSILIQFACDYDEKKKEREREEMLRNEYPSFVEKLRLYVLSGMTVKNAFLEISDNKMTRKKGGKLLEIQLKEAGNKLKNGVAEEKVYDEFASSCSDEYRKLAFILTISLRQGNDRIIDVLDEEARDARIYKSQICKKKADELGVRLLFPMTVMLILVMGLIMVPVYLGFN